MINMQIIDNSPNLPNSLEVIRDRLNYLFDDAAQRRDSNLTAKITALYDRVDEGRGALIDQVMKGWIADVSSNPNKAREAALVVIDKQRPGFRADLIKLTNSCDRDKISEQQLSKEFMIDIVKGYTPKN